MIAKTIGADKTGPVAERKASEVAPAAPADKEKYENDERWIFEKADNKRGYYIFS